MHSKLFLIKRDLIHLACILVAGFMAFFCWFKIKWVERMVCRFCYHIIYWLAERTADLEDEE